MTDDILESYSQIYPIRIDMEGGGFGSVILITMNQLRYSERNNMYPIVAYDADCSNAYFDASRGNEMWSHYFEPVMPLSYQDFKKVDLEPEVKNRIHRLSSKEAIKISEESPESIYSFPFGKWRSENLGDLDEWYAQQRSKGGETVGKYIKPLPHILKKVEAFYQMHLAGSFVVGLHIRGTDLHYAPVVSPAEYFPPIDKWIEKQPSLKLFLATDQAQYIEVFEKRYGDRIVYADCFRSDNEVAPFQRTELSPYQKGEDVLLDILLLSRADFLIKGSSNVGEIALYFNPKLECLDLGYKKEKAFGQSYDKDWDNHTNPPAWKLVSKRGIDTLAKDAASQNSVQRSKYKFRKKLKTARMKAGILKRKLKTLLNNPHFLFHWMYDPVDRLLAIRAIRKNTKVYKKEGRLFGPIRLDHLPEELQNEFSQDFHLLRPRLIQDRRAPKSISDSVDQIPDVCKKHMHYEGSAYIKDWKVEMIDELVAMAHSRQDFSCREYPSSVLQFYRGLDKADLTEKNAMVLGSVSPWVEAILLAFGAKTVTTIEYGPIKCEHQNLRTIDRLRDSLPAPGAFDLVCSFSSIEHSGLGRYGDEIDPYGDIKAMQEIRQWLVPGGLALIGVPVSDRNLLNSIGNKFYNRAFLEEKLFEDFETLNVIPYPVDKEHVVFEGYDWQNQPLFILKKITEDLTS